MHAPEYDEIAVHEEDAAVEQFFRAVRALMMVCRHQRHRQEISVHARFAVRGPQVPVVQRSLHCVDKQRARHS